MPYHAASPPVEKSSAGKKSRDRFDLLLAEYQSAREDDRTFASAELSTASVGVALIALLAAGLTQTCKFSHSVNCVNLPDPFLAVAPMAPAAVGAILANFGAVAVIRSYYVRALEQELRAYSKAPFKGLGKMGPASYVGLTLEVSSLRRGRGGHRFLSYFTSLSVLAVYGGLIFAIAQAVGPPTQVFMAVVYIPYALVFTTEMISINFGGRGLFTSSVKQFSARNRTYPHLTGKLKPPKERSLLSYIIVPRPEDWSKWLLAPGLYLLAAYAVGSFAGSTRFIVLWLILEYLIYGARYQWNDLRGLVHDRTSIERSARARLPVGNNRAETRRNIIVSIAAAAGRVGIAVTAGALLHLLGPVLILTVLIFAIAACYEWLRGKRPVQQSRGTPPALIALWLIVGLGYAIRAGIALAPAGIGLTSPAGLAGLAGLAGFGVMFVLLTWVLEATSNCRMDPAEAWHATAELADKPHIAALLGYVRYGGLEVLPSMDGLKRKTNCGHQKALDPRGRILAPWNIALLVAVCAGSAFGVALEHGTGSLLRTQLEVSGATAILLAVSAGTVWRVSVLCAATLTYVATAWAAHVADPIVVATPPAFFCLLYVAFRASSYHDLKHAASNVAISVIQAAAYALKRVVGSETWMFGKFDPSLKRWKTRRTG